MKRTKRVMTFLLALAVILATIPLAPQQAYAAKKKKAALTKTELTLDIGQAQKLKVKNGTAKKWTSSNKDVATVNKKGKVKGVASGSAIITVKAKNGSKTTKLQCTVYVTDPNAETSQEESGTEQAGTEPSDSGTTAQTGSSATVPADQASGSGSGDTQDTPSGTDQTGSQDSGTAQTDGGTEQTTDGDESQPSDGDTP